MTTLSIYHDSANDDPQHIREFDIIASTLEAAGILIEKWDASKTLKDDAQQDEILDVYRDSIEKLNEKYHFKSVDVVSLRPDNPKRNEMRKMFLEEHIHSDLEIRFFVDGSGLFYLHINDKVYCVLCEKNDLISVPANTTHWFDMGSAPNFKAIRLFTTDEGWVAKFTGNNIAKRFPDFDSYLEIIHS